MGELQYQIAGTTSPGAKNYCGELCKEAATQVHSKMLTLMLLCCILFCASNYNVYLLDNNAMHMWKILH